MTKAELTKIIADIQAAWPDSTPWPELTIKMLHRELSGFNATVVARAVDRFVHAGGDYRPTPAALVTTVAHITADDLRYTNQLPATADMTKTQRQAVAEYAASVRGNRSWAEWLRHG